MCNTCNPYNICNLCNMNQHYNNQNRCHICLSNIYRLQAFFSSPCMASITSQFAIYHINAPGQVGFCHVNDPVKMGNDP